MTEFKSYTLLGLDVGQSRIGVARANSLARLPEPLAIIKVDTQQFDRLQEIVNRQQPKVIVVGLPKNLTGAETQQSAWTREWVDQFQAQVTFSASLELSDEALSSVAAQQRYPKRRYIDDVAACVILDNYLGNPVDLQTT